MEQRFALNWPRLKKQKQRSTHSKQAEIESKRNTIEERLNSTKPLDDLFLSELQRQNGEYQAIIQAENTSPSDIEAAEARVEERNEEVARLQTQVEERERGLLPSERVKVFFRKSGVTLTAIFLDAGVKIGAV